MMMWKVWKDLSNKAKYRHLNGFVPIWEMRKELHEKEDIKDKLDYWDFYYLSNCYSDLNIITIKLKIIEEILKLF